MPIYEFRCRECGREFEELVLKRDEGGTCPSCGSGGAEKRMSSFRSRTGGGSRTSDYGDFAGAGDMGASSSGCGCGGCTASSCAGCGVSR
ncbi:MAG: zinc ribbon domain-containing protein [Deltaproteobacteria bacterium]|jgi:putative FmdB family regulatory protein|nr:zinc ribbon domain-containing protein [Deltaproteobacteria bacterium]